MQVPPQLMPVDSECQGRILAASDAGPVSNGLDLLTLASRRTLDVLTLASSRTLDLLTLASRRTLDLLTLASRRTLTSPAFTFQKLKWCAQHSMQHVQ
jgi:hypothetical protein